MKSLLNIFTILMLTIMLGSSCSINELDDLSNNPFDNDNDKVYFRITDWDYDGWILKVFFETVDLIDENYIGESLKIAIFRDGSHWQTLDISSESFSTNTFIATNRTCYKVSYVTSEGQFSNVSQELCLGN